MIKVNNSHLSSVPWHPLFFAASPVLALLATNITEISVSQALRALLISICAAAFLLAATKAIFRPSWQKAAALTSLALVLFFSYGHIYNLLETSSLFAFSLGRHRILAPIYAASFMSITLLMVRRTSGLKTITEFLNIVSLLLFVFPVFQIGSYYLQEKSAAANQAPLRSIETQLKIDQTPSDIYYIILDAYSRDDVLEKFYGFNNSQFLDQLEDMGFYTARCSQSNYAQTQLSLASSLNFSYLNELSPDYIAGQNKKVGIVSFIKHSAIRQSLESLGYRIVSFETGFVGTQIDDADMYLSPGSSTSGAIPHVGGLNGFEAMLFRTSAALIVADGSLMLPKTLQPDLENPDRIHRQRVLFTLDQLDRLIEVPGPKFVFAHIVSPHKPFVFGPQGQEIVTVENDFAGYRDQVTYLNARIVSWIEDALSNSSTMPIIVIQGDHGGLDTSSQDRMAILNTYYLPYGGAQFLYPSISPVNTFRVILNAYFGGQFELLEDSSLFSVYQSPFDFTVIRETRTDCS